MKNTIKNISFWQGAFLATILIFGMAAAAKQLTGPTTATTDNAVVLWDGTGAYKVKNSGVTVTTPATIVYGQGVANIVSLSTISGGGTATLSSTNNTYSATFSGATATIALPSTPSNGTWILHGSTTYNGEQIITIPSLVRPEVNHNTPISTITNSAVASGIGYFTVAFTAIGGQFVKVSAVGDAFGQ